MLDFVPGAQALFDMMTRDLPGPLVIIKWAAEALKALFGTYMQCDAIRMVLGMAGGRSVFQAYTTGCSLFGLELALGFMVLDIFEEPKLFMAASFSFGCFPECLVSDALVSIAPDNPGWVATAQVLGDLLGIVLSPIFDFLKDFTIQFASTQLRLGHLEFEGWDFDMSNVPGFISVAIKTSPAALFASVFTFAMKYLEDAFMLSEIQEGPIVFLIKNMETFINGAIDYTFSLDLEFMEMSLSFGISFPGLGVALAPGFWFKSFSLGMAFVFDGELGGELRSELVYYTESRPPIQMLIDMGEDIKTQYDDIFDPDDAEAEEEESEGTKYNTNKNGSSKDGTLFLSFSRGSIGFGPMVGRCRLNSA